MVSQEQADPALREVAWELMEMSYDELRLLDKRLPQSTDDEWREFRRLTVNGETLYVHVLMGRIGWLRRRINTYSVDPTGDHHCES